MSMNGRQARTRLYRLLLVSSALATATQVQLLAARPAHAQDAAPSTSPNGSPNQQLAQLTPAATPPDHSSVEEVVVTAERRSETVKNVPMSITAISSATLEKFDVQDLEDYAKQVPNVSFGLGVGGGGSVSFGAGVPSALGITIRGISGYDTTAFYIDDTPLPESLDPRILDIDHIEVLRGPQGTLFGASSMGGLVRVITQRPDMNTFSGTVEAQGYDMSHADKPGGETSAVVNLPLLKDFASVRISAFGSYTPGYFKRTYDDPSALNVTSQDVPGPAKVVNNVGAVTQEGVGVTFRLTPIEGLVLTPLLRWQKSSGNGFPLADYNPHNLVQRRILDEPESYNDEFFFAAFTGAYTVPFGRFISSTTYLTRESYDLEDGADANSAFFSPTVVLPGPSVGAIHNKTFTEEDRFESNFDFPVQAVGGVFYQNSNSRYVNIVDIAGLTALPDSPFDTDIAFGLNSLDRITQLAGFLGLTYTPIKPLEIQVGGRESKLTNTTSAISYGIFGTPPASTHVSESSFTPRFSAKYRFNPQTMVYVTAAEGFRVGGANPPLGSACAGLGYNTADQIPYGSDTLWSYEGGIKTSFLDNRLSVNADVYHINWRKIQQTETLSTGANGCFAALTLNLGDAQSDGSEIEAEARITDNFSVHLAGGYEDARLTTVAPGTEYTVGEPLNGVPKWTATASADYDIPQSWGNYFVRGQYSFTGDSTSYTEVATGLPRKSYQLVDMRVGANYHAYTVTLFAKNLFDARPNLSDEVPVSALAPGRYRFFVGPPREVGVEVRSRF